MGWWEAVRMPALSTDLRQRILSVWDEGMHTRHEVADRFQVSLGMVKKLIQQRTHQGSIENLYHRVGRKRLIKDDLEQRLKTLVGEHPDATLAELREKLALTCSLATIHNTLKRLGWSYKKKGNLS
jgi:transposase